MVDGRVSLPDSTMQDLVRMLRPTYEAEQQAQPDECFPGEPKVAVPQGLIGAACCAIRNKRDGGKVLEQLRRYSVGDRSQPLAPQQAAPKAAPGEPSEWKPLKTSKEGQDAVRSFFREKLKRHDFDAYIMGTLAADFACVLGGYLESAPQQEAQKPVATLHCNDIGYVWARATEVGTRMRFEQPINLYTAPQPAPDCHHRPPCDECAAIAAQGGKDA